MCHCFKGCYSALSPNAAICADRQLLGSLPSLGLTHCFSGWKDELGMGVGLGVRDRLLLVSQRRGDCSSTSPVLALGGNQPRLLSWCSDFDSKAASLCYSGATAIHLQCQRQVEREWSESALISPPDEMLDAWFMSSGPVFWHIYMYTHRWIKVFLYYND